ncbi:unnamed protein product [Phytomonas sp. Hart1]|nr:unnamed protein product [Phytomonas sp. Hart1]|eukprot:CCW69244.1 unnamed protein product [Phytomonas sp. isolate Hart1]
MQAIAQEYLAACQRQHLKPLEGFTHSPDPSSMAVDLEGVALHDIRVFALALSRVGLDAPRRPISGGSSSFPSPPASSSKTKKGPFRAKGASSRPYPFCTVCGGKVAAGCACTRGAPSPRRVLTGTLVRISLRGGGRLPGLPQGASATLIRPRSGRADGPFAGGVKNASDRFPAPRLGPAGMTLNPPTPRRVLAELVEGVRHVVDLSRDSLTHFEFAGFPLDGVPEGAARLMRALVKCPQLRSLSLRSSSLSERVFSILTTTPSARFSRLAEVSFAGCGLTDACARGLRALVCLGRDAAGLADWKRSLRAAERDYNRSNHVNHSPHSLDSPRTGLSLAKGGGLMRLEVSDNHLGDLTLLGLAETLRGDSTLRFLDFSRNAASLAGMQAFVHTGVLEDSVLESVDLSHNLGIREFRKKGIAGNERGGVPPLLQFRQTSKTNFLLVRHGIEQCLLLRQRGGRASAGRDARSSPPPVQISTPTTGTLPRGGGRGIPASSIEPLDSNTTPLWEPSAAASEFSPKPPYSPWPEDSTHGYVLHPPAFARSIAANSPGTAAGTFRKGASTAAPLSSPPPFPPRHEGGGGVPPGMSGASFPWGLEHAGCHPPPPPSSASHYSPYVFMMPVMAMPPGGVGCPRCGLIPSPREEQLPPYLYTNPKSPAGFTESAGSFKDEKFDPSNRETHVGLLNSARLSGLDKMVQSLVAKLDSITPREIRSGFSGELKEKDIHPREVSCPRENSPDPPKEKNGPTDDAEGPRTANPSGVVSLAEFASSNGDDIHLKGSLENNLQRILEYLTHSMEYQELQLSEKLEKYHQQTTSRLDAFRRDLADKISHLSQDHRAMEGHLFHQLEDLKESSTWSLDKDENELLSGLMGLIQAGMERVKRQISLHDREKPRIGEITSLDTAATPALRYLQQSKKIAFNMGGDDRQGAFLREVNTRLKTLGW